MALYGRLENKLVGEIDPSLTPIAFHPEDSMIRTMLRATCLVVIGSMFLLSGTKTASAADPTVSPTWDSNPKAGDTINYTATASGLTPNTTYFLSVILLDSSANIKGTVKYKFKSDANGKATIDSSKPDADGVTHTLTAYDPGKSKNEGTILFQMGDVNDDSVGTAEGGGVEVSPKPKS